MRAESKGLGRACPKAGEVLGQALLPSACHQPAPCPSLFWASLPTAFPITSQSTPVVLQGSFFTSNPSKEGILVQAQPSRSSSQTCCPILPLPGISLISSLQAQVHLSTSAPPWYKVPVSQGPPNNMKVVLLQGEVVLFVPVPPKAEWQMAAEDPNAHRAHPQPL